jgi:hypothetical protein
LRNEGGCKVGVRFDPPIEAQGHAGPAFLIAATALPQ